jgi:methylenetetrahydrofolate reductase (NADPH)
VFERTFVLVGVAPPRSAASARFMRDHLPGVVVPDEVIRRLDEAEDGEAEGVRLTVEVVERLREIDGIAGVHVMGLGHEGLVRRVIEKAGLMPRGAGPGT